MIDTMNIGLSIVVDTNSTHKSSCMQYVTDLLENRLKDRDYHVINHYWIICQAVKTIPGFERFTAIPRHRFVEHRRLRNLDNTFTDYYGVYSCGFKIDNEEYDSFITSSDEEATRTIARKVVESLSNLDRLSKKAAGFDKERFKSDVIQLFQEHGLL
jgi:hypothetical protein